MVIASFILSYLAYQKAQYNEQYMRALTRQLAFTFQTQSEINRLIVKKLQQLDKQKNKQEEFKF